MSSLLITPDPGTGPFTNVAPFAVTSLCFTAISATPTSVWLSTSWPYGFSPTNDLLDVYARGTLSPGDNWRVVAQLPVASGSTNAVFELHKSSLPTNGVADSCFVSVATQDDSDGDGLSDAFESLVAGTDPILADTDGDMILDGDEVALGLDGEEVTWEPSTCSPTNRPDAETSDRHLVFLHGANVTQERARGWCAEVFKRMWQSGMTAKFTGVTWTSDIGSDANYQENASNAFFTASVLAPQVAALPGTKVLMAHSLGNMVCSSMVQDYGLQVSKYIMCDSSVPSEAYYPANDVSIRVHQLVHPQWEEYPTNSWASNWHKLFTGDLNDERKFLGWPGRFVGVVPYAVNFYSTGDEVLELLDDNDVYVWTGITSGYVQYSWHHQELWKGRAAANVLGGTTWSGWNIEERFPGIRKISVSQAQGMSPEDFKTNTVFYCYPPSMNEPTIPLLVRGAHLAQGIPALTRPTGTARILFGVPSYNNFNLDQSGDVIDDDNQNNSTFGIQRPNNWPTRSRWDNRWLHSDMKDVSYFFNFKFYEKVIEKGGLK